MSPAHLSVTFFLQMAVILLACRCMGLLARRFGQPQVVGEMIAGVLLGPSLFGYFLPELQQGLFPRDSLDVLYVGAQLGIGVYMFVVGIGIKTATLRVHARSAIAVSVAGMLAPFALGALLALWLLDRPGMFGASTRDFEAVLFLGAAMAITAFPVLARIIQERGLTGTSLGTLTLAAGAANDAVAWCLLAVVLSSLDGDPSGAILAIVGAAAYALVILTVGPKLLARLGRIAEREKRVSPGLLGVVLALLMLAAWGTDAIGLHAVFGGFLLGIAMPRGLLTEELKRLLEPFTVVFLLPMFFTFSGLNTRFDLVITPQLLGVTAAILVAATAGKGLACWAAARLTGADNPTALAVGALMNARGLMELILLNIVLQRGLIEAPLFSMMVLMAIVTTLMASPLFEWVYGRMARRDGRLGTEQASR